MTSSKSRTLALDLSTKDGDAIYIIHRVEQSKLERAIERTIEDEIPFLKNYTPQQKAIYQLERMARTSGPMGTSKIEGCYFDSHKFHCNPPWKHVTVTLDKVERTIFDEIPYLFDDSAKHIRSDRRQK